MKATGCNWRAPTYLPACLPATAAVHTRCPMPVTVTHMFNSCPLTIVSAYEHGSVTRVVNRAVPLCKDSATLAATKHDQLPVHAYF